MKYREFGAENRDTVMLLHGGGLSWWNYREEAELLRRDFHVILPILDGHAGSDRPFSTIESNASEIIAFIDENLGGSVSLIGGLSLGGQVLLEMLSQRRGICRCALAESALIVPSRLTHALIAPAFGGSYGLIKNKSFARLQFRSLRMKQALFEDYYRDTCRIAKADMIAFMKANTAFALKKPIDCASTALRVFIGEKEGRGIRRSAELLRRVAPGCSVTVLPGLYHGEFSLNHARDYADAVKAMLRP
ncbi:MAG: alpha/beta hydrolase [Clostridia bacterium]|nr:alpha/beta hydrolase [Clostridia bacterium]